MNKKGIITLAQTSAVVIVLLTIGIILTVGLLILADLQTEASTSTASVSVINESRTGIVVNQTFNLNERGVKIDFVAIDLVAMINSSNITIDANNYTFDSAGTITMTNASNIFEDGRLNFSYTFTETAQTFALNGSIQAQEGIDTIASFQSIFGIVIAAAVVLGLVVIFR